MSDYKNLANILVNYSCTLKKNQKVLIEQSEVPTDFLIELAKAVKKVGAYPFFINKIPELNRELLLNGTVDFFALKTKYILPIMKDMDAYIGISGVNNLFETSDISTEILNTFDEVYAKPVHLDERVANTKWVILRWPNGSFAQSAQMSTASFKELYFKVCTLDYGKMDKAMDALKTLMEKTDKVRIISNNTDLSFSIKGISAIKCSGKNNIPDGEVFTAPIKNSINGKIQYNIPSLYNGTRFNDVYFEIENGKIIKAISGAETAKLNQILDLDEGSRYFGEFAFGLNPYITKPMLDILFDEKICGSIHLTPGACYDDAPNGNKSSLHWDLVLCQLPEYGGGEIYFDNILIRKDGKFVLPELLGLNPENLV